MADVALLQCPVWDHRTPPRGLACMAGMLEHHGIRVRVINLNIRLYRAASPDRRRLWAMNENHRWRNRDNVLQVLSEFADVINAAVEEIRASGARIAGFSVMSVNVLAAWETARLLKERLPGLQVVFGGPQTFIVTRPEEMFTTTLRERHRHLPEPGVVDFMVRGEGEEAGLELFRALLSGRAARGPLRLPGVVDLRDGWTDGGDRPLARQLAALPMPRFSFEGFGEGGKPPRVNVEMSRGCVLKCAFCSDTVRWRRYRPRGADAAFAETRALHEERGVTGVDFIDLLLNADLLEMLRLCDHFIAAGLPIDWAATCIVSREMTPEVLSRMRRAGCSSLAFGVENFHDDVLRAMKKGQRAADIAPVIRAAHDAGIKTIITLMVGFPGETEDIFRFNMEKARDLAPWVDEFGLLSDLHFMPFTPMWEFAGRMGVVAGAYPGDWTLADDPTNTPEVRQRRYAELLALARDLGKSVDFENYSSRDMRDPIGERDEGFHLASPVSWLAPNRSPAPDQIGVR